MIDNNLVDLERYSRLTDPREIETVNAYVKEKLLKSIKGNKMSLAACGWDVRKLLLMTHHGFVCEQVILNYLKRKNESQNWRFVNPAAGKFELAHTLNNKPDLINDNGTTVEVKGYTIYKDVVYFVTCYDDPVKYYEKELHNADYVVVYDDNTKMSGIFDKKYFLANVETTKNNYDEYKHTHKLKMQVKKLY